VAFIADPKAPVEAAQDASRASNTVLPLLRTLISVHQAIKEQIAAVARGDGPDLPKISALPELIARIYSMSSIEVLEMRRRT